MLFRCCRSLLQRVFSAHRTIRCFAVFFFLYFSSFFYFSVSNFAYLSASAAAAACVDYWGWITKSIRCIFNSFTTRLRCALLFYFHKFFLIASKCQNKGIVKVARHRHWYRRWRHTREIEQKSKKEKNMSETLKRRISEKTNRRKKKHARAETITHSGSHTAIYSRFDRQSCSVRSFARFAAANVLSATPLLLTFSSFTFRFFALSVRFVMNFWSSPSMNPEVGLLSAIQVSLNWFVSFFSGNYLCYSVARINWNYGAAKKSV